MSYRREAKDCFSSRNAGVFHSKVRLRVYIACPDLKCFERHFKETTS